MIFRVLQSICEICFCFFCRIFNECPDFDVGVFFNRATKEYSTALMTLKCLHFPIIYNLKSRYNVMSVYVIV